MYNSAFSLSKTFEYSYFGKTHTFCWLTEILLDTSIHFIWRGAQAAYTALFTLPYTGHASYTPCTSRLLHEFSSDKIKTPLYFKRQLSVQLSRITLSQGREVKMLGLICLVYLWNQYKLCGQSEL